jgi:hypothetical protein
VMKALGSPLHYRRRDRVPACEERDNSAHSNVLLGVSLLLLTGPELRVEAMNMYGIRS